MLRPRLWSWLVAKYWIRETLNNSRLCTLRLPENKWPDRHDVDERWTNHSAVKK